jgi:hypothetical protein
MDTKSIPTVRVPVILMDEAGSAGAELFNPNIWTGVSKGLVQSCWTEYAVLHYSVSQLAEMCKEANRLCKRHVDTLNQQWSVAKFDLKKVVIFGQESNLYIGIEAFFLEIKTLLDLLAQLLSSENIVTAKIDGFHRAKSIYGGKVLNALESNVPNVMKDAAAKFSALISEHKRIWIDKAISARDQLIHPEKAMPQLMFKMDCEERAGKLVCVHASPPSIGDEPINQYAQQALEHVRRFASDFMGLLKEVKASGS